MAIVWSPGGQRFSFGNLDAAQQSLYEDQPGLAFQRLMQWYGQGDPNFANTTLGRYIASQQDKLSNDYLGQAAQQQADWAGQKSAYDAQLANAKSAWEQAGGSQNLNNMSGAELYANYQKLLNNPWQAPGPQLTWTRYLEQNPAGQGALAQQFGLLSANQRGANPGAFEVRRNLW
jgi:hypothetical protein